MGMFDSFYFEDGVLPDNKVPPGHEFQTKSLYCDLDVYKVDVQGNVRRFVYPQGVNIDDTRDEDVDAKINDTIFVYSHEFLYDKPDDIVNRKYLGCKYQEYKIVILNNKIAHVEKVRESGYEQEN